MVVLCVPTLREASRHEVRAAMRQVWRREGWSMNRMGFADFERVAALIDADHGAHDLPGGVQARRTGNVLRLERSA
jgi:hypothetical protein